MVLADVAAHGGLGILCTILLFATIIAFIVGLAEVLGFGFLGGRLGNSRFSALVVFVVLLIAYVLFC